MKQLFPLFLLLCCAWTGKAQSLPELDIPIQSRNYYEICAQLDRYFEEEYVREEDPKECEDDEWVKYQRWKYWWRDRVKPDGSFPDLRAQWLDYQKVVASHVQDRGQPTWKSEGPSKNPNGGYWGMGRTKHVAFHPTDPNTFFVGTPDGGIWRTKDHGVHWTAMGDGLPYLPVGIILIDYLRPDTMYISLGDKGGWWNWNLGVYRSTDGGTTWAPTGLDWELSDNNVIYNMIMSPADPLTIFAATNRGVRRTTDGGNTWETVRDGEITDIEFRPGDPQTLYAADHNYWGVSQVIKSTDGGNTWVKVSDFQVSQNDLRLAVNPIMPDWLGVHFSKGKRFLLSKDGGVTYTNNAAPEDDWGVFAFSPSDTNIVYLCGVSVSRSSDQGATWEAITHWYDNGVLDEVHADAHDLVYSPHNPNEVWYCNDGGIYKYDETTQDWTDYSSGLAITQFYRIAVSETGTFVKLAGGSQDNGGWLRSTFGWKHTNGGDGMCVAIDPTDHLVSYAEYWGGNDIYRSTNDFFSSVNIADNIPGQLVGAWVTPFFLNPQNPRTFVVGYEDVYRSFDRGDHFDKLSDNLTGAPDRDLSDVIMSAGDTNFIAACHYNIVYQTSNSGQTWSTTTLPGGEGITRLFVDPANNQRMWATKGGLTPGEKVFTTLDGWQTPINISENLPNVPINCILFDSITNYLMLGTDIGVFYSDADSVYWRPYGLKLPAVYVLDLKIRKASRTLYAGTHGRGIFSVVLERQVGTKDVELGDLNAMAYPNPAQTVLLFKSKEQQVFDGEIRLFDSAGKQMGYKSIKRQTLQDQVLDVAGLPRGLYFLQVVDQNGRLLLSDKISLE